MPDLLASWRICFPVSVADVPSIERKRRLRDEPSPGTSFCTFVTSPATSAVFFPGAACTITLNSLSGLLEASTSNEGVTYARRSVADAGTAVPAITVTATTSVDRIVMSFLRPSPQSALERSPTSCRRWSTVRRIFVPLHGPLGPPQNIPNCTHRKQIL